MSINDYYYEITEDGTQATAVGQSPKKESSETEKTFFGFLKNLGADIADIGYGVTAPIHSPKETQVAMSDLIFNEEGERSLDGVKKMFGSVVDRAGEIISDPAEAFYERPLSTGLDIAGTVAPTLRGVSAAAKAGGMDTLSSVANQAANGVEMVDPMSWPGTAAAMANRAGVQSTFLDDSIKRTEGVIKPKLSQRHKESDPSYRREVITNALERDIDPTEKGMANLQAQLDEVHRKMDAVMQSAGNRQVETADLVGGWKEWAQQHIRRTNVDWEKLNKAVDAKEASLKTQYQGDHGGEIVSINTAGLRDARISADGKVNHNARNLESDSVQAEVDRLYANYLREKLGEAIPELKELNAEASALYNIYDMYNPAVMRMNNRMPIALTSTIGGTGIATAIAGNSWESPTTSTLGAGIAALPIIANATPTRLSMARSNYNSSNAGFGDFITGSLLRDRNNLPGNIRKGVSFTESLFSQLMPEDEE